MDFIQITLKSYFFVILHKEKTDIEHMYLKKKDENVMMRTL